MFTQFYDFMISRDFYLKVHLKIGNLKLKIFKKNKK